MFPVRFFVAMTALSVALMPSFVNATAPVVALDAAALKAAPDVSSPTVATTAPGSALSLVGCLPDYSWCQATLGTQAGWVEGARLAVQDGGQMYPMPDAARHWQVPVVAPPTSAVVYGGGAVETDADAARRAQLRSWRARRGNGPTETTDMVRNAPLDRSPPIPQDSMKAANTTPNNQVREVPLDRSPPIPTEPATPKISPTRPLDPLHRVP